MGRLLGSRVACRMEIQQTASRLARPRFVALLLAAFCAVALHQGVYDDFEHQQLQVVRGRRADSQGTVTILTCPPRLYHLL